MSISMKRRRGRPVGTVLNDHPTMEAMADRMVVDPSLSKTAAARLVLGPTNEATIRRLQSKWTNSGEGCLAAARERRAIKLSREAEEMQLKIQQRLVEIADSARCASEVVNRAMAGPLSCSIAMLQAIAESPVHAELRKQAAKFASMMSVDSPILKSMGAIQAAHPYLFLKSVAHDGSLANVMDSDTLTIVRGGIPRSVSGRYG